ncbi:MAG: ATP synthase F1 subunit delta [Planctomycetes bacterium]|nr:ATP synthase F1 subunit delta [Planctomycetota bacterium]
MAEAAAPNPDHPAAASGAAQPLARVYAQAFWGAAEKAGAAEAAIGELDAFLEELVQPNPAFAEFLRSRIVSRENKEQVFQQGLQERVSPVLLRFLLVLNRHQRLDLLRDISRACHEIDSERRGRVPVQVTVAAKLDGELTERIRVRLRELLQKEPMVSIRVDPELLGGLVVRVGDSVYDGSLATQLKRLRDQMLQRSVHAIQSRRDRFRVTGGD